MSLAQVARTEYRIRVTSLKKLSIKDVTFLKEVLQQAGIVSQRHGFRGVRMLVGVKKRIEG